MARDVIALRREGVLLDQPVPLLALPDGGVAAAHDGGARNLVGGDQAAVEVDDGEPDARADVAGEEEDAEELDEAQGVAGPVPEEFLQVSRDAQHADEAQDLDDAEDLDDAGVDAVRVVVVDSGAENSIPGQA